MPLDDVVISPPRGSNRAFDPRYSRAREIAARTSGGRQVRAATPYWFPIVVPFAGQLGENLTANFQGKNFDLELRAAWTDLVAPRVSFTDTSYGLCWSNEKVPLSGWAGRSDQVHPLIYMRRPYILLANSVLRGDFIDDAGTEAAGQVVWACERPDSEKSVTVVASYEYQWEVDLGLSGGASNINRATTQPVDEDVLIYGAISTSTSSLIRIVDNSTNNGWSDDKLPVGAFAGIVGEIQPIVWYPMPYYVPRNTAMIVEWQNLGSETGKFFTFICERILRAGSQADTPTPVRPTPRPVPVTPRPPSNPPPIQIVPQPQQPPSPEPGPSGYPQSTVYPLVVAVIPPGTLMSDGTITQTQMVVELWEDGHQTMRPRDPWE